MCVRVCVCVCVRVGPLHPFLCMYVLVLRFVSRSQGKSNCHFKIFCFVFLFWYYFIVNDLCGKKILKKQTKKTKKTHVKWNKKVYTFILLKYKHLTICNYKNFPFHFFYLQKIVLLKMEEEDIQGHPSRIPVQDLFLLLSFHRLELLYFGASY